MYEYSRCKFRIEKDKSNATTSMFVLTYAQFSSPESFFTILRIGVFSVYLYLVNIACIVVSWMGDEQIAMLERVKNVFFEDDGKGMQRFQVKGEWGGWSTSVQTKATWMFPWSIYSQWWQKNVAFRENIHSVSFSV